VGGRRLVYECTNCGATSTGWLGRCPVCGQWDTLRRQSASASPQPTPSSSPIPLEQAASSREERIPTGIEELDRVLGGGLVRGMSVVVGGEPGVGKSTLMLQAAGALARAGVEVVYVAAEESPRQVGMRAARLGAGDKGVQLLATTSVEEICRHMERYQVAVVDSIQAVSVEGVGGVAGSISQVRAAASRLVEQAKAAGVGLVLVGHVTKEGVLAGPRVLEHMVDTVIYFEPEAGSGLRVLRAVKNRFGATDEVGLFTMGERGLSPVADASGLLLAHRPAGATGSVVCAAMSGSRPLLVEVQALVSPSPMATPRRQALGLDVGRVHMVLAVLGVHAGLALGGAEVFVNVTGGIRLVEPAADLAVAVAVASSALGRPAPGELVCFGEVGLAGELRAVGQVQKRLGEAARHGLRLGLTAPGSYEPPRGMRLIQASTLAGALRALWPDAFPKLQSG